MSESIKKVIIPTGETVISTPNPTQSNPVIDDKNYGLSVEEINDPNKIQVTISDPAPIIILFGARASGKTMSLIRLTRYLNAHPNGYKVVPDKIFRRSDSGYYERMCERFDESVNSDAAAVSTNVLSFMLVKVLDKWGKPICQILEAPGEHYFDEKNINMPFPRYIESIRQKQNPKTWMFIVENEWKDDTTRLNYANKIQAMQSKISHNDRKIFFCHKCDLSPELIHFDTPNKSQFFANINHQYPGIFNRYMNQTPIIKWFKPYNFDFVVFSAGTFSDCQDGTQSYEPSKEYYPAMLWNKILKSVRN
jgi:hypothetical protein